MADIVEDPEDPGVMLYLFCMLSMNLSCFRQSLLLVVCQEIGSTELLFEAALLWSKKNRKTNEFVESEHAKRMKKRKDREEVAPVEPEKDETVAPKNTSDRLNRTDTTLSSLMFVYINCSLFKIAA